MKDEQREATDFLVKYKNDTFNLKRFLHKHPGGVTTLAALRNCDLTKIMAVDPVHSQAALYLMKEYKVNAQSEEELRNREKVEQITTVAANGHGLQDMNTDHDKDSACRDKAAGVVDCDGDRLEVHIYRNESIGMR